MHDVSVIPFSAENHFFVRLETMEAKASKMSVSRMCRGGHGVGHGVGAHDWMKNGVWFEKAVDEGELVPAMRAEWFQEVEMGVAQ
jgi:hypothetical protein